MPSIRPDGVRERPAGRALAWSAPKGAAVGSLQLLRERESDDFGRGLIRSSRSLALSLRVRRHVSWPIKPLADGRRFILNMASGSSWLSALAFSSIVMVVGDEARRSGEAARLPVVPNTLQVTQRLSQRACNVNLRLADAHAPSLACGT